MRACPHRTARRSPAPSPSAPPPPLNIPAHKRRVSVRRSESSVEPIRHQLRPHEKALRCDGGGANTHTHTHHVLTVAAGSDTSLSRVVCRCGCVFNGSSLVAIRLRACWQLCSFFALPFQSRACVVVVWGGGCENNATHNFAYTYRYLSSVMCVHI